MASDPREPVASPPWTRLSRSSFCLGVLPSLGRVFAGGLGHQGAKDTAIVLGLRLPLAQEWAGDPEGQLSLGQGTSVRRTGTWG